MKIGIVVYSQTGNTYTVALKLQERLSLAGHSVEIERLSPIGEVHPGIKNVQFERLPEINNYEALVFASPVQGFTLATPMKAYLKRESIKQKKVACFVTMFFPFSWMGGNRAIKKIKKICESKGAIVSKTGIINWSSNKRNRQIVELIESFIDFFGIIRQSEGGEKMIESNNMPIQNNQRREEVKDKGFMGGVYFLTIIGAAIYFIQHSTSFWDGLLGILKALIWPLLVIYKILGLLNL